MILSIWRSCFAIRGEKATNVMIFVFLGVKWRSAHSKAKENRTRLLSDIEYFELALVQSQHKIFFYWLNQAMVSTNKALISNHKPSVILPDA